MPLWVPFSLLRERASPVNSYEALKGIGEFGHGDFDPVAGNADHSDELPLAVLLAGEHLFDRQAFSRAPGIGSGFVLGHRAAPHAPLADNALGNALLDERVVFLRAIGRVWPYA